MSKQTNSQLYAVLKDLEVISSSQLELAYKESSETVSLGSVLLDKDLISDENLGKITADVYGISFVDFGTTAIDYTVFTVIPENIAKKHEIVAFKIAGNTIHLATHNPDDLYIIEAIAKKTGLTPKIFYTTSRTISDVLTKYSQDFAATFNTLIEQYMNSKIVSGESSKIEAPIIKAVDMIFDQAYQQKASDIHIEPEDESTILRFRVDGILKDIVRIPKELHNQIVTRVKVLGNLRTDEHQSAQDGKLHFTTVDEKVDVRVSIVPTTDGEKVVMRLLSEKSRRLSLTDLGFSDADFKKVKVAATKPYGMILATGPTGSGKTTTLYSMVKILNKPDINIMTIEDPVEYDMDRVNQIQVNNKANLTFAEGLKSIVRQDPDIILVGEVRDEETASIAINSALTGHLVLSSVHTNDAATAIPRLIDMGVEPFLVASSVNLIIAQRLVRKICRHCIISKQVKIADIIKSTTGVKRGDEPTLTISKSLITKHFPDQDTIRVYEGKGCQVCHDSGYMGRIGIFEVLEVSEGIKDLIVKKSNASDIGNLSISQGMETMFDDGLEKVKQGLTTLEEVMRVAKE
ncbi:Flp pilus assembly complex ATPase component TadA [Candidatus Woesebacteria bacterium]|nr:Flp pilus assembly complex ATPase component TadA [Candidatus Woesebacteria bacterium]